MLWKLTLGLYSMMQFEPTLDFAQSQDQLDPLKAFRSRFYIPTSAKGTPKIYFTGNSLGLQPKTAKRFIDEELEQWKVHGVEGHFSGSRPWMDYHHFFTKSWQTLIGCEKEEVVVMNNLTVNLHLLMVSFYRPTKNRFKIIMEGHAFPSDQYAIASQVAFHGFEPDQAIVEVFPGEGAHHLTTSQIESAIEDAGDELALVMFSGVQYYTGQFFDIKRITEAAHRVGAYAGFDLAHAVGNLPLQLHDWSVDFATWCSYKYLNSGPGGVSGIYIHKTHAQDTKLRRLAGWWGHDEHSRFQMEPTFKPMPTAEGWQLSNAPIFNMASHLASLEIFSEATMGTLRRKSVILTGYLHYLLDQLIALFEGIEIITPRIAEDRGCQLSILVKINGKAIFDWLTEHDVVADWREPDVIRVAPVPLYNTFEEVFRFYELLEKALGKYGKRR